MTTPPPASPGPETSRWRPYLLLLGASSLVFAGYFFWLRGGEPLFFNDTYEYAQAARNLAEGRGLATDAATVLEVGHFGGRGLPLPYYMHDPGNSILMAAVFRLAGARETAVGLGSGLCFVLLAPLTYSLGRRFLGHGPALLGGLLVSVNAQLLLYAGAGYSETPIAFTLTALLLLMWHGTPPSRAAAGAVFGGLVLLRANALPFLPLLLLAVAAGAAGRPGATGRGERLRAAGLAVGLFLLGAALVLGPNLLRNWQRTGRATFAMHGSTLLIGTSAQGPGKGTDRFSRPPVEEDAPAHLLAYPGDLLRKMWRQGSRELETLLQGGQLPRGDMVTALIAFLFAFGLLFPPREEDPARRRFRWLVTALALTALLVGAAFHLRSRHLYGFLPIAILFAAEGLGRLAEGRVGGARRAGAFIVIAAALLGAGPVLDSTGADAERWDRHHRFHRKLGAFLAHHSDPGDVVLLANPGSLFNPLGNALAWHSRRTLLEYSPFTLDSSLLRGRALLVLSCSLAASRPSSGADEAPPPESLGLAPQAGFRHDLGQCTFYRRPEGDRN